MPPPSAEPRSAPGPWTVRDTASESDCRTVLTGAFARESAVRWICGDSTAVRDEWFAATLAAHATLPGARRLTLGDERGRPVAAAVLTPPGAEPSAGARAAWASRTLRRCGLGALRRTLRHLRAADAHHPDAAWTLEFIGVVPEWQGRGLGRLLLDHVVASEMGAEGLFLTTADPANEALYRRVGFATERSVEIGPLTVMLMSRPA
ncbi:GNAT family N-acetyltransferase [Streptomyces sp. NPDC057638]|uniref:GNAT family N-acetyltransferase n=1 Tax=Streptomyces sp. NPDC057638 TaxID=3346190 RepID=UPI00367376ED